MGREGSFNRAPLGHANTYADYMTKVSKIISRTLFLQKNFEVATVRGSYFMPY